MLSVRPRRAAKKDASCGDEAREVLSTDKSRNGSPLPAGKSGDYGSRKHVDEAEAEVVRDICRQPILRAARPRVHETERYGVSRDEQAREVTVQSLPDDWLTSRPKRMYPHRKHTLAVPAAGD